MNRTSRASRSHRRALQRRMGYRPQFDQLEQRAMLAADLNFTPLPTSADTLTAGNVGTPVPFDLAAEYSQTVIQRRGNTATTDPDLGVQLGQNTLNESGPFTGRFLFSTARENTLDSDGFLVGTLNRTDLATGETINLLDIATSDFQLEGETFGSQLRMQNLHAIRWTPWGTLLVAEAIDGIGLEADPEFDFDNDPDAGAAAEGLVYEIFDPTSSQPRVVPRTALGSGNFQGIDIDSQGNVYYSIDRGSVGAVLRFQSFGGIESPLEAGDISVLAVAGSPFGEATWEPIFVGGDYSLDDALDAGPAYRELNLVRDVEIGMADFGEDAEADETLYVAVQGANQVVAIDLDGYFQDTTAPTLYNFIDSSVDPDFNDPVDLAVDASGRVYVGEAIDPPPAAFPAGVAAGNDVWVISDSADDEDIVDPIGAPDVPVIDLGDADEIGRLASLKVSNSSVAGLYVNPFNNNQIYVNVSSVTAVKNQIVRFDFAAALVPSVTEIDLGNGEVLLSIVGTNKSESITITGGNLLTVRIGTKVYRGLAPSNTVIVYGLGGNDYIVASSGNTFDFTVFGGAGNDYIATGRGNDSLAGEAGNDRLLAGLGNNILSGGADNDSLSAGNGDDVLSGDSGDDRLVSNAGADILLGGDGNDGLVGGLDNDYLNGGAGNDVLDGYFGDDVLAGGTGNDRINGGSGTNVLLGGDGADFLYGARGDNLYIGDITAIDNDDLAIAQLAMLWQTVFFSDTAAQEVYDFLDLYDGDADGDGIINDRKNDILMASGGVDVFLRFGTTDTIRYFGFGDIDFNLNDI